MGAWSFASHTQALIHSNKLGLKTHKCILIIFLRRSEKSIRTVVTWIWITGVSLQFGLQEPSREFKVPLCSQLLRTLQEIVHFGLVISIWSLFFGWLPAQDCIQHVEGKVLGKLWDSPSCKSFESFVFWHQTTSFNTGSWKMSLLISITMQESHGSRELTYNDESALYLVLFTETVSRKQTHCCF